MGRIAGSAHPNFLYAAPDATACGAFIKEGPMNFTNANQHDRKFEVKGYLHRYP
jgi:hypothetical protein